MIFAFSMEESKPLGKRHGMVDIISQGNMCTEGKTAVYSHTSQVRWTVKTA